MNRPFPKDSDRGKIWRISGSIENFEQYEVIYVGYPIWLVYHNLIQCTQA